MLFKSRFHDAIRRGALTVTYRAWRSARVKPGRRYPFGADEALEVEAVATTELGALGDREARAAGFATAAELARELERTCRRRLTAGDRIYAIRFRYVGRRHDPRVALREDVRPEALAESRAKLERMDRRSRGGPWTRSTLAAIAARPRTAASKLAAAAGRELAPFKADVRKLRALGLTLSHRVGYELSPRGRALLEEESR